VAETPSVARALAEAARTFDVPRSLEEMLEIVVQTARASLPEVDDVGLSIAHRDGRIETVVATSDLVRELDDFQYTHQEGPCYYSVVAEPVVVVEDLRHEQRWPGFVAEAVRRGVTAQMGLRLYTERETIGALNLYALGAISFSEETRETAQLLATHAALALGRARQEQQLTTAIASRQVIGQAVGIVMERYGLSQDRAFAYLARASSTGNIKIRDIAQGLVDSLEERKPS
jgi:GAF domain-containing protein